MDRLHVFATARIADVVCNHTLFFAAMKTFCLLQGHTEQRAP